MSGIRDRHTVPRAYRRTLRFSLALPLLTVALVLAALWAYAGSGLVRDGLQLRDDADLSESVASPAHRLVASLQEERRLTAVWQAGPSDETRQAMDAARDDTEAAAETFRRSRAGLDADRASVRERAGVLIDRLDDLSGQREVVDAQNAPAVETFRWYTDFTTDAIALLDAAGRIGDGERARQSAAAIQLVQLAEAVSRQRALVAGGQRDNPAVREEFSRALVLQRQARTVVDPQDLPAGQAEGYERLVGTPQFARLVTPEEPGTTETAQLPEPPAEWESAADVTGTELRTLASRSLDDVATESASHGSRLLLVAALGTLAALAALVGAGLLARRLSRSLVGRVTRLRRTTEELTGTTLPQLTERQGREQHAQDSGPSLTGDFGSDEVGGLAVAMREQWEQVVETVLRQARGREGSETVFLGLARRTQVLINRMIPMLDKLEREHQDSKLLKDIFAVDHLATRVRRHTENLLILGGALPARRWGKPVPVYEVMRSAISETEDYSRVEALPAPRVSLTGRVVADVVHLLAELIENGTSFSPPETKVSVSAEIVARGRVALEVVDRGLGMAEDEYERVNRLLADPPKLDVMALGEAPRLGLFVVARLAKRHGLEISLRKSPYGGTLAVVLLPSELLEESKSLLDGLIPETQADGADQASPAETAAASSSSSPTSSAAASAALDSAAAPSTRAPASVPPVTASPAADEVASRPARVPAQVRRGERTGVTLGAGAASGAGLIPPSRFELDDNSGYPTYGGAGLLPMTPEARGGAAASAAPGESEASQARSHPSVDHVSRPAPEPEPEPEPTTAPGQGPAAGGGKPERRTVQAGSLQLPVRVRGESLAEQLRIEQQSLGRDEEEQSGTPSPHRAGAVMAAIQSGNRRARDVKPASPAGDQDSEATTPGNDADVDGPARKDQR